MKNSNKPVLAIAGASGFIGTRLIRKLKDSHSIIALSRGKRSPEPGVEWRQANLFSLDQTERALQGAELAIYLVHSMLPPADLTQANFEDLDVIAADNFRRAAEKAGVRQIIYIGGLVDPERTALSMHLASRCEVERVLGQARCPVTVIRAGLVVGAGGSSFEMLTQLVRKLPVMLCPRWTQTPTTPISVDDLVALVDYSLDRPITFGRVFEVGGSDTLTYLDMMKTVARVLGRRRVFIGVPFFSPNLSRLWVRLVTGKPKELVGPLVQSLKTPMIPRTRELEQLAGIRTRSFEQALREAVAQEQPVVRRARVLPVVRRGLRTVCSVQRLRHPLGRDAAWVAAEYLLWLPRGMRTAIRVRVDQSGRCEFLFRGIKAPLLVLRHMRELSRPGYEVYSIEAGVLVRPNAQGGRLEFRSVVGSQATISAIHEFEPRLPWWIYRSSQAIVHLWVMQRFARHLWTRKEPHDRFRYGIHSKNLS